MKETGTIGDIVDAQSQQQGFSVIQVKDGHVFTFTTETIERLLVAAEKTGKVVVFIKHGVPS